LNVLLDDFISTENDVWETEKIPFSIGWTWYAWKNKGHTIVMHIFYEILLRSYIKLLGYCVLKSFYIDTINCYVSNNFFIDNMNNVSRCELVYNKKYDILPNNYKVSLTTSRCWGIHFASHTFTYIYKSAVIRAWIFRILHFIILKWYVFLCSVYNALFNVYEN